MEMLFGIILGSHAASGILYGPWTFIYGFASITIILVSDNLFKNLHLKRWIETIIVLCIVTIFITCLEWLGGVLIEYFFHYSYWDYTNNKFNMGKYVCLEFALVWAVLSMIFIYVVRPFIDNYILKIPKTATIIMVILFIIDVLFTFKIL